MLLAIRASSVLAQAPVAPLNLSRNKMVIISLVDSPVDAGGQNTEDSSLGAFVVMERLGRKPCVRDTGE
eukprot:750803-Amphidinium_carterae.1